jgi:tetratricopeptide (TPR) repeat protein
MAYEEEAVRTAEAANHPYGCIRAYGYLGGLYLRKGDLQKAIPMLERGLSLSQMVDIWAALTAPGLGLAYALSGRIAEPQMLLAQVIEPLPASNLGGYLSPGSLLGETYLLVGQIDEALGRATRALEFAGSYKQRGYQGWALRLLGVIAVHRDPPEIQVAEEHFRQALSLATELGMRPLQAHCHLGLGNLYVKISTHERACIELSMAIELYRAMGMIYWLPQAEAALAEVGVR